jgi:hypothetical protein
MRVVVDVFSAAFSSFSSISHFQKRAKRSTQCEVETKKLHLENQELALSVQKISEINLVSLAFAT